MRVEMSGFGFVCAAFEAFDSVALKVYGDEKYAAELRLANPEYCDRLWFDGGELLRLPKIETVRSDERAFANTLAPWKS